MIGYATLAGKYKAYEKTKKLLTSVIPLGAEVCFAKPVTVTNKKLKKKIPFRSLQLMDSNDRVAFVNFKLGKFKDTLDAEAWSICLPIDFITPHEKNKEKIPFCAFDSQLVAFKLMPITYTDYIDQQNIRRRPWREIYILRQSTLLYEQLKVPNLPIYFSHNLCLNTTKRDYENKRLLSRMKAKTSDEFGKRAVFIFNEMASYDLEYWLKAVFNTPGSTSRIVPTTPTNVIRNIIFQIFLSLAILQKNIKLIHFDFHIGNVLVTEIIPGGTIEYIINGTHFYLPNLGYLCNIWDFSRSILLTHDSPKLTVHKLLFHGEHNFGKKIYSDRTKNKIRKNIDSDSDYLNFIYAFDTFKITKTLALGLEIVMRTKTQSTSARSGNRKLAPEIKLLNELNKITLPDLTTNLTKRHTKLPKDPEDIKGSAVNLLFSKHFKDYQSKPTNKLKIIGSYEIKLE